MFHRTGDARLPIVPIWGPNIASEIKRHFPQADAMVQARAAIVGHRATGILRAAVAKVRSRA